ncbi:SIT4 phosphatase-associated family protein isoform 2 [Hibiscus syriacus]|uniref:SIT4 phosphatase-associated family protein isoform 2 n=1 Tax=Hibiscus syriacus TaxID=106335 RepID=A0A6A3CGT6_HIBSY|nr:serine/threonine-protein phosphatase 6 regulatory subunit 2-like isoform X1 [Hibiscus syriacus]KAE8728605.1 SIT4 phosphatase-associated family protein isoform 2 [Hibiscus syriacus]
MFWRMTGLSTASPIDTILDKDNFTLEELLDEDEIIQECKSLNGRLINFLRDKAQVEQLIQYIVVEPPQNADKKQIFKFPSIACEIFTCEVDIILKTLVEDEGLMNLLFSFLNKNHSHSTQLAGYFSRVVICLLLRKTSSFMQYIKGHQEIVEMLVDLIGITSIMEVLIRLIGADEHMYTNYMESMQWIENTNILELIVDKFSTTDSTEVHANAAETLCAITRFAPPGLAAKITSPNFMGRLFRHALEDSRPKSVLVNSLSVYISLLDPKRLTLGVYRTYNHQVSPGSTISANPKTVEGMLENLGNLLKLLDISSSESTLLTTYGKLQPPLGKHRLKIVELISVLLMVGSEAAEKELIQLGSVQRILNLFFEYPYNNFLHHLVENIILSCLESKNVPLVENLLRECNLLGKILEAEKNCMLASDPNMPTVSAEGRAPPKMGNIGHLTRISNKLVQLGNSNGEIQAYLQENSEWVDWQKNVLSKRNAIENVYQWACGRPTTLQDRRDSDDDYQDRDYDVTALANNLSQAFRYGIYNNDDMDEVHGSLERDDEDVYFDDESAEVVISSLRLGDDQESGSLFTNSNWFAFEDDRVSGEHSTGALPCASPNTDEADVVNGNGEDDKKVVRKDNDLDDTATSSPLPDAKLEVSSADLSDNSKEAVPNANDKLPSWVEWRDISDGAGASLSDGYATVRNGELQVKLEDTGSGHDPDDITKPSPSSSLDNTSETASEPKNENLGSSPQSSDVSPSPPVIEDDETASGTGSASEAAEEVTAAKETVN